MSNDNVIAFPSNRVRTSARHDHRRRRGIDHLVPRSRTPGPMRNASLVAAVLMMLGAIERREQIPAIAARLDAEVDPQTLREVLIEASARIGDIVCLCLPEAPEERS